MLKTPLDRARVYVTALVRVRIRYFLSVAVFGRGIFICAKKLFPTWPSSEGGARKTTYSEEIENMHFTMTYFFHQGSQLSLSRFLCDRSSMGGVHSVSEVRHYCLSPVWTLLEFYDAQISFEPVFSMLMQQMSDCGDVTESNSVPTSTPLWVD